MFVYISYNNKTVSKNMQKQYNLGVEYGYNKAREEFSLEQTKIIEENRKTVKEIEKRAENTLRQKQKELEHEKQIYQAKLNNLQSNVSGLQNTVNTIRRNNGTSSSSSSSSASDGSSADRAWGYFGSCVERYSNLGQRAEELNEQLLEWKVYGEAVNNFADGVEELNDKKDNK